MVGSAEFLDFCCPINQSFCFDYCKLLMLELCSKILGFLLLVEGGAVNKCYGPKIL